MKINKNTNFATIREKLIDDMDDFCNFDGRLIYSFIYQQVQFNFRIINIDANGSFQFQLGGKVVLCNCIDLDTNKYFAPDWNIKLVNKLVWRGIDHCVLADSICSLLKNSIRMIDLQAFE